MSRLCENEMMCEDMEEIAKAFEHAEAFAGKNVLVTGSTGLIGSQAVLALLALNDEKGCGMTVLALVRSEEKAKRIFGEALEREDLKLVFGDVADPLSIEGPVDYIIHGASPTSSKFFVEKPAETIKTALSGTENILELAKEKQVKSMVYLSSLEVYGTPSADQEWMTETTFGTLDPAQPRSSYSEGKRMAECLCVAYAKEYGVPVKMARLSQTFGPGVDYNDGRVFMDFARCALEKRDIVLHTQGRTVRTYLYTKDAVAALLTILVCGEDGKPYNVTNKDTAISIREMAELVSRTLNNGESKVVIDIPEDVASMGYNPEMVIRLDPSRLEALGWSATVGMEDMFRRMAAGF